MENLPHGSLDRFIGYLTAQVNNQSIYVLGAKGEDATVLNEDWIKSHEDSGRNAERAISLWYRRASAGFGDRIQAFDHLSLGGCAFTSLGVYDLGFYNDINHYVESCDILERSQLKRGDWVFRQNSFGRVYHIGFVVDDHLNVIECKGRSDGVVKRGLNSHSNKYWNAYGRPLMFKDDIEADRIHIGFDWRVDRTLYEGLEGEDVKGLQLKLLVLGYRLPRFGADGIFGEETKEAVLAYQADNRMVRNARVGAVMVRKLDGEWTKTKD